MRYLGDPSIATLTGVDLTGPVGATADALWSTRDASHDQCTPGFTSEADDRSCITQYTRLGGIAHDIRTGDLQAMDEQQKHGVCQSIGMDALGAVIRLRPFDQP